MSDQVAARDTTFDDVECKSMWLDFSNIQKDDYLTVSLKIDGKEKVINEFYIPGLSRSEGITLHGHNLTWVFNNRKEEIEKLKAENQRLENLTIQLGETRCPACGDESVSLYSLELYENNQKKQITKLTNENAELKEKYSPEKIGAIAGATSGAVAAHLNEQITKLTKQNEIMKKAVEQLKTFGYQSQFSIIDEALQEAEQECEGAK